MHAFLKIKLTKSELSRNSRGSLLANEIETIIMTDEITSTRVRKNQEKAQLSHPDGLEIYFRLQAACGVNH
jgi:hypothetical protein